MSIDASEQHGEKVREDLNIYSHPGTDCFWRRGTIILSILRILAILIQTTKTRAGPIKVRWTLLSCSCCDSIDIKVFQTFAPHAQAAPSCKSCASWPSCFRQQKRAQSTLRSSRTLLSCSCCASIDIQVLSDLAFILFILRILPILLQTKKRARGLLRSYRTLSSCFLLMSIDMKVWKTFGPYAQAAPSCKSCPSWPS